MYYLTCTVFISTIVDGSSNAELFNIVTPLNVDNYERMLIDTNYPKAEREFLVKGFRRGFPIGYQGPVDRRDSSRNIPFTVGNKQDMWDKLLKETRLGRVAGPFYEIPFDKSYVQSPIGLVPKAGDKTRLIFHLSYDFPEGHKSINFWTPEDLCKVKYNDLDHAVRNSLKLLKKGHQSRKLFYAKTDLLSAFRILPNFPGDRKFLIMKAEHPQIKGKYFFFIDKNISFGASISCSHFQRVSESLRHLVQATTGRTNQVTNYLDDFLFVADTEEECNWMVSKFIEICDHIGFPVSEEKTVMATNRLVFLGILLDGISHTLAVPEDKRLTVLEMVKNFTDRKKATVHELQKLSGHLNFLNRAIVPGRAFTRRMYAKFAGKQFEKLKSHHHIRLDKEFKGDCYVWSQFLENQKSVNRPFVDLSKKLVASKIAFFSDASAAHDKGFGIIYKNLWTFGKWEPGFIERESPSIQFLELYALVVGVFVWQRELAEARLIVRCDNDAVCRMINGENVSKCKYCMYLLRMLTLNNLKYDRRIFTRHISTKKNNCADALSRMSFARFFKHAPKNVRKIPEKLPSELWPLSRLWNAFKLNSF